MKYIYPYIFLIVLGAVFPAAARQDEAERVARRRQKAQQAKERSLCEKGGGTPVGLGPWA